jgi:hypothetical protein
MAMSRTVFFALPFVTACYTYAPIEVTNVQPGTNIRARVSASTAERLEPLLGVQDARSLRGLLVANGGDTLIVQVPTTVRTAVGSSMQTLHQRVSVPRAGILELEESRLDRTRTTALAAAGAAAVAIVIAKFAVRESGGSRPGGGGGGPELRFPILLRW